MSIKKLLIEALTDYSEDGIVTLYHYSNIDKPSVVLDVNRFGENSWTKRDKAVSATPKLFFYLDPSQKERFFNSGKVLYSTDVSDSEIYNILKDPLGIKEAVREANQGVLNMDDLINRVVDSGHKGMYYKPKRDLVVWFENIEVFRIMEEETTTKNKVEQMKKEDIKNVLNSKYVSIISAERDKYNESTNRSQTEKLRKDLSNTEYMFTEAYGGYVEHVEGEKVETEEASFMVWSDEKEPFFSDMEMFGRKYGQESILIKSPDDNSAYFIGTTDSDYLSVGEKENIGSLKDWGGGSPYYTRVGNYKFMFSN